MKRINNLLGATDKDSVLAITTKGKVVKGTRYCDIILDAYNAGRSNTLLYIVDDAMLALMLNYNCDSEFQDGQASAVSDYSNQGLRGLIELVDSAMDEVSAPYDIGYIAEAYRLIYYFNFSIYREV